MVFVRAPPPPANAVNRRAIGWVLGSLCILLGVLLLLPAGIALLYDEHRVAVGFGESAAVAVLVGLATWIPNRRYIRTSDGKLALVRREGVVSVALAWIAISVLGALPFLLCRDSISIVDALFESTSGFTTTGASIFTGDQIDGLSHGIAFWRSLSHWIGGIGIALVFAAFMPLSSRSLYRSEGIGREENEARMRDIAVALLRVYVALTALHAVLLWTAGMSPFDATVHAFSTVATGGFSNRGASIAAYDSATIELICIAFMIAAGTNFAIWTTLWKRGPRAAWREAAASSEVRAYLGLLAGGIAFLWLLLWFWGGGNGDPGSDLPDYSAFLRCGRDAAFSLTSIQTCTGYATADFDRWPDVGRLLLMVAAFVGGCGGSTAGGIKVFRLVVVARAAVASVRSFASPRQVVRVAVDGKTLDPEVLTSVARYFALWVLAAIAGALLLTAFGSDIVTSVTSVVSCMSNVGPGLAGVGPSTSYADISTAGKLVLCALMVLGRLEFYAIVALFLPSVWRR
jgi:trk system potassium uptake protein TrkH